MNEKFSEDTNNNAFSNASVMGRLQNESSAESQTFDTTPYPENLDPSVEAIEQLEKADLWIIDKRNLLLVELGEKPAAMPHVASEIWDDGDEPKAISNEERQKLEETASALGLLIDAGQDKLLSVGNRRQLVRPYLIAKNQENLELLKEAYIKNDDTLYGQAFGYPETAIEAFVQNRHTGGDIIESGDADAIAFTDFSLSAENAENELATGKRWAEATKTASPQIYGQIMELKAKTHSPE